MRKNANTESTCATGRFPATRNDRIGVALVVKVAVVVGATCLLLGAACKRRDSPGTNSHSAPQTSPDSSSTASSNEELTAGATAGATGDEQNNTNTNTNDAELDNSHPFAPDTSNRIGAGGDRPAGIGPVNNSSNSAPGSGAGAACLLTEVFDTDCHALEDDFKEIIIDPPAHKPSAEQRIQTWVDGSTRVRLRLNELLSLVPERITFFGRYYRRLAECRMDGYEDVTSARGVVQSALSRFVEYMRQLFLFLTDGVQLLEKYADESDSIGQLIDALPIATRQTRVRVENQLAAATGELTETLIRLRRATKRINMLFSDLAKYHQEFRFVMSTCPTVADVVATIQDSLIPTVRRYLDSTGFGR